MSHIITEETKEGLRDTRARGISHPGSYGGSEKTEPPGLAHPRAGMETTLGDEERGSVCIHDG
jgi:hypothetical protein